MLLSVGCMSMMMLDWKESYCVVVCRLYEYDDA